MLDRNRSTCGGDQMEEKMNNRMRGSQWNMLLTDEIPWLLYSDVNTTSISNDDVRLVNMRYDTIDDILDTIRSRSNKN